MHLKVIVEILVNDKHFDSNAKPIDYIISSVLYLLFFGLIFITIQKYKFKNISNNLEIDEIGKQN